MTAGWAVVAGVAGAAVGAIQRVLLGRIRRGVRVPAGLLEGVSALVAVAGVLLAADGPMLVAVLWAGVLLVLLSAVDISHHRLPDVLTVPAIPLSVAACLLTGVLYPGSGSLSRAVLAGLVAGAVFVGIAVAAPRAMGLGDVKLVPSLGILLGYGSWAAVLVGIASAFVLGAALAVVGLVARRLHLGSAIPFGPCLLTGTWLTLAVPEISEFVLWGG